MKAQRRLTDAARFWLLYAALLLTIGAGTLWTAMANAQTPQDFKVCSDTACVQIIFTPVLPPCPAKPADEMQPGTCPTGTVGSWTQSRTYSSVAAPTCWTAGAWTPASPPAGVCTTPTPGAPTNLSVAFAPNGANPTNSNVTLTWGAVPGVTQYEVWRCTGASCTNFVFLADASAATHVAQNQPPGLTWRYRVRAWKPTTGPYSTVLNVTTQSAPPPTATGTATLQWAHDGKNTDGSALTNLVGWRVLYGTSTDALTQTLQVPNPSLRTYVVDKLAAGTWYFAVRAYTSAGESANSNVATKVVP